VQGKNDPRVVPAESEDLIEDLRKQGVTVDYLLFEDEGHDVHKFKNLVVCYNRIVNFFSEHLKH
jgi:dipeptidyl aminopeptidase/acylaminoacyl peptidase